MICVSMSVPNKHPVLLFLYYHYSHCLCTFLILLFTLLRWEAGPAFYSSLASANSQEQVWLRVGANPQFKVKRDD